MQPQTVEAVLLIAADAISASRPGARGESLEHYIKRLEALEELAAPKPGVEKAYALQAGREIRVIVKPTEVDDDGAVLLSHEIAREIEDQLEYPGQVKVIVIRESARDRGREVVDAPRRPTRAGSTPGSARGRRGDVEAIARRSTRDERRVLLAPVPRAARRRADYVDLGVRRAGRGRLPRSASRSSTGDRAAVDWWAVMTAPDGSERDDRRHVAALASTPTAASSSSATSGRSSPARATFPTGRAERHRATLVRWPVKRYHVTTFGCQMNAHDSERIKGMLESLGLGEARLARGRGRASSSTPARSARSPTRSSPPTSATPARASARTPTLVIAVGGCYAEAQRERIFELYPYVDVAFGPGLDPAPRRLARRRAAIGVAARPLRHRTSTSPADLPMHRERRLQAWVQVSMGCNSKCAYCIVPAVRGREQSRRPGEIVAEVTRLAARRRPGDHAARPERQLVGPRPRAGPPTPSSASCCAPATPSTGSSGSASRARTRRTSASR